MGIGIVGTGIAGMHLGLYLQQQGVPVTLYTDVAPEELPTRRLLNSVSIWRDTRERERLLGVNHWDDLVVPGHEEPFGVHGGYISLGPPDQALRFFAPATVPGLPVDHRIVLPRLAQDFTARGGQIIVRSVDAAGLDALSETHDLVVVATGKYGLGAMFPTVPERCDFDSPQRILTVVVCEGYEHRHPMGVLINSVPGAGDVFAMPLWTFSGPRVAMVVEALPGGPLESLASLRYDDDPTAFEQALLARLDKYTPAITAQIDRSAFRVTGPLDVLQGAITPTVRRPWARLGNGRWVMGLGDVHTAFDPIFAQGANAASAAAFVLGEAICGGGPFDEAFCSDVGERMWEAARPAMVFNNFGLAPAPPPHVIEFAMAAAGDPVLARRFFDNFTEPDVALEIYGSPEATRRYLEAHVARAGG